MNNNTEYSIVYASDDNFAAILGTSIISLFENNKNADNISLYILDSGIKEINVQYINEICNKYNRPKPIWIEAVNIEEIINKTVHMDRGSLTQYARLFISRLLPNNLERILYLDCDVIVNDSIEELWNLDLKGMTIGALMDAFSKYYRLNINLKYDDIMFNSGVMLIDIQKWRKKNIEEKLIEFIYKNEGKVQQGDQGVLNAILSHETYCFHPRFNSITIFYDFSYKEMLIYRNPIKFYKESEIKLAIEKPVIIHYTTSFRSKRPWVEGCKHQYKYIWDKYNQMSPWADIPNSQHKQSLSKEINMYIYNILPKCLSLRIASILQVYGRPLKNYIINKVKGLS